MKSRSRRVYLALVPVLALSLAAFGSGIASASVGAKKLKEATLNAAGATFPQPFYEEAISEFTNTSDAADVTINYGGGGSGKGRQDFKDEVVDWAGSDAPYNSEDVVGVPPFYYFPTVVAPITVSYNLDTVDKLKLSGPTISAIFQREITQWDDPAIAKENPNADLPSTEITVARRSDGSGTTENFTIFLAKADPKGWELGTGSTVDWPADTQGGNGNSGVAEIVSGTDGAIGYVDFSDARATGLKFASIRNASGNYIKPSVNGASQAAASAPINDDLTYDPLFAPGEKAYPITAPTWMLVYQSYSDSATGAAVKAFLNFIYGKGQKLAPDVDYAPLAGDLAKMAKAQVKQVST